MSPTEMGRRVLFPALIVLMLLWTLAPMLWVFIVSFKIDKEVWTLPIQYIPRTPTLENYVYVFAAAGLQRFIWNSTVVALLSTGITLVTAVPMAYALVRFRWRGRNVMMFALLSTQLFPMVVLIMPIFMFMKYLGMVDSLAALAVTYTVLVQAFCILMIRGFFMSLPKEIEECAMIDGATRFGAFVRVAIPLIAPGIAAAAIFSFVSCWNELMFATMLINSEENQTLPVGLNMFKGQDLIRWGPLAAGTMLSLIPAVAFFLVCQRFLISGLTAGAVKG